MQNKSLLCVFQIVSHRAKFGQEKSEIEATIISTIQEGKVLH
jgi:hypothetical protein